jgi:hypothetical protein
MTEQFVPFEVAVKMKELGFDEKCLTSYDPEGKLRSIWNIGPDDVENELYLGNTPDKLYCRNSTNVNNFIAAPLWSQLFRFLVPEVYDYLKNDLLDRINYKHKEKFENHE